jgi:hypothetical protein
MLVLLLENIEIMSQGGLPESVSKYAYNLILNSYARMPDLGDRISRTRVLIEHIENLADKLQNPSLLLGKISYASLIQAIPEENYAKPKDDQPSMKPDLKIYALVLDVFTKRRGPSALGRA